MRTLGNILWFVFLGWWTGTIYVLLGCLMCITIIGIPIGKALFEYAKLMYLPFGKCIVRETFIKGKDNVSGIRRFFGILINIIWFPIGFIMFVSSIGQMLACFVSIIFIPAGIVIARASIFLLAPIGAKVISKEENQAIITANAFEKRGYNATNVHLPRTEEDSASSVDFEKTKASANTFVFTMKSMFFKAKGETDKLAQKMKIETNKMMKEREFRGEIKLLESKIDSTYGQLGKKVYELKLNNEFDDYKIQEYIDEISSCKEVITDFEQKQVDLIMQAEEEIKMIYQKDMLRMDLENEDVMSDIQDYGDTDYDLEDSQAFIENAMPKCPVCNTSYDPNEVVFCSGCGNKL